MSELYYSQRLRNSTQSPRTRIGKEFWAAFLTYVDKLSADNYLCEDFGDTCSDGHPAYRSDDAVAAGLRLEFGDAKWPVSPENKPPTTAVLDLVEFLSRHVSEPTDSWYHGYCGAFHPTEYDRGLGRAEFTTEINKMFNRFNHPYALCDGVVGRVGLEVMENRFSTADFRTNDEYLRNLIGQAIQAFRDRSSNRRLEALKDIVDAYERVKTLENPNKKTSVKMILGRLSTSAEVCTHFGDHLTYLTKYANTHTIRHHEVGKAVLKDDNLVEYLFYSYYTLVVFLLRKLENDVDAVGIPSNQED